MASQTCPRPFCYTGPVAPGLPTVDWTVKGVLKQGRNFARLAQSHINTMPNSAPRPTAEELYTPIEDLWSQVLVAEIFGHPTSSSASLSACAQTSTALTRPNPPCSDDDKAVEAKARAALKARSSSSCTLRWLPRAHTRSQHAKRLSSAIAASLAPGNNARQWQAHGLNEALLRACHQHFSISQAAHSLAVDHPQVSLITPDSAIKQVQFMKELLIDREELRANVTMAGKL